MVFTSVASFMRLIPPQKMGPDSFWRKRKFLKFSAHFRGRKQNCYRLAMPFLIKALKNTCKSRKEKAVERSQLLDIRLSAACEEHGFTFPYLKESLIRSNILLNKKVLADLAIWEPRTFKCITDFAWNKAAAEELEGINELGDAPSGVLLKETPIK